MIKLCLIVNPRQLDTLTILPTRHDTTLLSGASILVDCLLSYSIKLPYKYNFKNSCEVASSFIIKRICTTDLMSSIQYYSKSVG